MCRGMSMLYGSPGFYNIATSLAHWANFIPSPIINCSINPWAEGHKMMQFPKKPFHELFKELKG
jgi:L-lactate dehydrogenase complex protein LldF